MSTDKVHHLVDRIAFILVVIIGVILFFSFSYSHSAQLFVIFGMVSFYFLWGIFHHFRDKTLDLEVFFEYLAIALIAIVLIFSGI